jgi:drug/metabolite transporter (DMT)-like permease
VLFPIAVAMFVRATDQGPVALVATLFGTVPVWVLIFSTALSTPRWNVLNEPLDRETLGLKVAAVALIVGGVAGIALL